MSDLYASIDLGGTKIACALATAEGEVICESTVPTESYQGPAAVLERMAGLVNRLSAACGQAPLAAGVSVPGLADLPNGMTKFLPNLPTQWRDVAVRDRLQPQIGCPVYLLNDVRTATLGELTYGHGRDAGTMVFYALGTGIGGGIAVDGKLRLGPLGAAGELGHMTILPDGPLCGCGNHGCLETLAAGPVVASQGMWLLLSGRAPKLHEIVGGDCSKVTPREMALAAAQGDESVREVIVRAATYLGLGIGNIVTALHPDLIVLGGGMAEIGPLLFDTVRETVRNRVRMFPTDNVRIEKSLLGDKAGMLGGIALATQGGLIA